MNSIILVGDCKSSIQNYINSKNSHDKIRIKKFLDFFKYCTFTFVQSKNNDHKIWMLIVHNEELSDEELSDFMSIDKKSRNIQIFKYENEVLPEKKIYRFHTSDFEVNLPEDHITLREKFKLKLKDLPSFSTSFNEAKYSYLFDALEDNTYRYNFVHDIPYEKRENINDLIGLRVLQVYDVDHESDEAFMMQYLEWNGNPLGVITKYADKSYFNIMYYSKEIESQFCLVLRSLCEDDLEEQYVIGDYEEPENGYGSTIVLDNKMYFTIYSPYYCYNYKNLPNPHRCVMTSFNDVQMKPITLIDVPDRNSINKPIKALDDGVEVELTAREVFFLGGEHA